VKRHQQSRYLIVGEGLRTTDDTGQPVLVPPSAEEEQREFRFSRLGDTGRPVSPGLVVALAAAMTADGAAQPDSADPPVPAGFTYLAQFVDHDLTMDPTALAPGSVIPIEDIVQGRSPALDLDSLYGRGPADARDSAFYTEDGLHLRMGTTAAVTFPDQGVNDDRPGFDLPRRGTGVTRAERRAPLIPDPRNDENLAVAQIHLAFIRFHNQVVDDLVAAGHPPDLIFGAARDLVVRHYQWMLRTDLLPRLVDPGIVEDVFTTGRKHIDATPGDPGTAPTMPIEFSVAAYRLGHSMIRGGYQWNRVFNGHGGPGGVATLLLLFRFTGVNGNLSPPDPDADPAGQLSELDDPDSGSFERLPTNWIADFRRLFDFAAAGRPDLTVPTEHGNVTKRIDTLLVDPLAQLPLGAFGGRGTDPPPLQRNLAFRNLARAHMVELASGQQTARTLEIAELKPEQILDGAAGADLGGLSAEQRDELIGNTPLWFYILREAEIHGGRLTGVGGRVVAEVFHRAVEGSRTSIVREPAWRPSLGPDPDTFRMVDLLLYAFEGRADLLNPLGD